MFTELAKWIGVANGIFILATMLALVRRMPGLDMRTTPRSHLCTLPRTAPFR